MPLKRNDVTSTQGITWFSDDNVLKVADDFACAKSSASPREHLSATLTQIWQCYKGDTRVNGTE